jgi:16S rRNA G966 N2-methylase RsmD
MASAKRISARTSRYHVADKLETFSMNGYPGSKGGSGVAEKIIREMRPHQVYIEGFAGKAAVWRKKLPAAKTILIDKDPMCCNRLRSYIARHGGDDVEVIQGDALKILPSHRAVKAHTLVYLDPPYLRETRTKKRLFDHELCSPEAHNAILDVAMALDCMVMISGYESALYERRLKSWRLVTFNTMTHGGPRVEHLWCNFTEPDILHDPRWVGGNYRDRENLKKQQLRWAERFRGMDARRRQAIALALINVDRVAVEAAMRTAPAIAALLEE